ncbi:MAG TPA: BlaI/MecI/CopY family transcriptional regulator [Pirellulales bacterium]|nr:BlaI/MecI/CopY family transcriptional regulator [Pirellulales bacterium]
MADSIARVADAELRVLKILWDKPQLSAREVTTALYPRTTTSEIGTVQSLLQRLETKGLVHRDRSQHVHRFTASITRIEFAGHQLQAMVDRLTDGSVVPLLAHLVHSRGLSDQEKAELRELLDEGTPPKRRGAR